MIHGKRAYRDENRRERWSRIEEIDEIRERIEDDTVY